MWARQSSLVLGLGVPAPSPSSLALFYSCAFLLWKINTDIAFAKGKMALSPLGHSLYASATGENSRSYFKLVGRGSAHLLA